MSFMLLNMVDLHSVATPKLKCLFAMVNRIKHTPVAYIVVYFKNVPKMSGPIECTSMVTRIAMNLGCLEMANLAYIEGDVPILGLDHFVHVHILREDPIILYLCCMVIRQSSYLTQAFNCTLVKVIHCSLIGWERRATASQDHLTLMGELACRQHNRTRLHYRLTLRSPSGTLGTGVATRVTMRVVTTPLAVTPSLPFELEPPSLLGNLTTMLLWSGTSVMGLTRLSTRWKGSDDSSDNGLLCTCANGDASLHRLTDQHDA
jgi:hypothetical protein